MASFCKKRKRSHEAARCAPTCRVLVWHTGFAFVYCGVALGEARKTVFALVDGKLGRIHDYHRSCYENETIYPQIHGRPIAQLALHLFCLRRKMDDILEVLFLPSKQVWVD